MKILMIANYVSFPWENGNCRFISILDNLDYNNNEVELITTEFYHNTKKKRTISSKQSQEIPYKITLIPEPGYKKNISLRRFYSHFIMSKRLHKYLKKLAYTPDVIYCSVPSLDMAKVAVSFAKRKGIKIIIDIQDLWPEAYKMIFNFPIISNIIYFPMKLKANYIYSNADQIIAVSETYLNRGMSVNKRCKDGLCAFLGTNLSTFDTYKSKKKNENSKIIKIVYIGTLGHSYDLKTIIDAIKLLKDQKIKNLQLIVLGDGPLKENFENYSKSKGIDALFTGRLAYPKMVEMLCGCDIAVNPITHGAAQSIINKVGDYAAAGLPVISTQECQEYKDLLSNYNAGFNCENGNAKDVADKLKILINDKKLRHKMGMNNRKLAEEKFDRAINNKRIIKLIYSVGRKSAK